MAVLNKYHHGGRVPAGAINIMRGSEWGNPYRIGLHGTRDEVIELHRIRLWFQIKHWPGFADKVKALHGKQLCCCCSPLPCHGDTLIRAAAWLHERASR